MEQSYLNYILKERFIMKRKPRHYGRKRTQENKISVIDIILLIIGIMVCPTPILTLLILGYLAFKYFIKK